MQRIALGIEYDGTNYYGWQRQRHHLSVQSTLELAISKVADHPITTACAGRTDAKVHAWEQVVHFDTHALRDHNAWLKGINTNLPRDIRVKWSCDVPLVFDARKSALYRRYVYVILNESISSSILRHAVTWIYYNLDIAKMQEAANYLLGTHDFSAFRGAHCQAKTPIRTISNVQFTRYREKIIFDITANAFLHHMVRNIVGTLLLVGQGKFSPEWISNVLSSRDRREAGAMAPPQGLYLLNVAYPEHFNLPTLSNQPWFLSHFLRRDI